VLTLRKLSISSRLVLLVAVAVALTLFDQISGFQHYSEMIHQTRLERVRSAVESAQSIVAAYAARAERGEISREAAQEAAKQAISGLRYAGRDYVFIADLDGVILLQPAAPEHVGKSQLGLKDSNGTAFIAEAVRLVRERGEGSLSYVWPKPGSTQPEPKLTFVKGVPSWGWLVGSGVYTDDIARAVREAALAQAGRGAFELALLALLAWLIGRAIARPLRDLTARMGDLAGGRLDLEIPRDQGGEIGAMQAAVAVFKDNAVEVARLTGAQAEERQHAESERRRLLLSLADSFEGSVDQVVKDLSGAAARLSATAGTMADVTADAARQSDTVASATTEASTNVQTVAAATEELTSSITEIARQVHQSAEISRAAVEAAHRTDGIVRGLAEAAQKIGAIVSLITDIAAQTNLLALNATIEAARAGEAGKGFAVVAGEVKGLATQTGRATDEIASQIGSVQAATRDAVEAISGIASTIEELNRIGAAIASAVEQQGAATQEISRNTQQAAIGTETVTRTVGVVASAVASAGRSAQEVSDQAGTLAHDAATLRETVSRFLDGIRR